MERTPINKLDYGNINPGKSNNFVPVVAPGVTKDEVISVSADGSEETSRCSASGDRLQQTASGVRLRDMLEWHGGQRFTLLEVLENISQKHFFRILYIPTEKGGTPKLFTHFPEAAGAGTLRELLAEGQDGHLPRATKFGDTTADHKNTNEEGESRLQHRYAIVVPVLAALWLQSDPCQTKTSQETVNISRMFLEPEEDPKAVYTEFLGTCQSM